MYYLQSQNFVKKLWYCKDYSCILKTEGDQTETL